MTAMTALRSVSKTLTLAATLITLQAGVAPLAAQNGSTDWIDADPDGKTVTLDIVAGLTGDLAHWNFNGYTKGTATLTIPVGYDVVIEFRNDDPIVPHSLGVGEIQDPWPPMFQNLTPVFEGAVSSNPTSMTESTMPGESETIRFTTERVGAYAIICYIPAHAFTGMWMRLNVVADGDVSFDPGT